MIRLRFVFSLVFLCGLGPLGTNAATTVSPEAAPGVIYEQCIGETLPLDLTFKDETGRSRELRDFFGHAPVVMVFGYFRCPQLCTIVSDATESALRALRADPGTGYEFLYVSIDPTDTPAAAREKKIEDVRRLSRPGAEQSWHYLTGAEPELQRLARAAGFHYQYDSRAREYAHPSGFVVVTPQGVVSRYFLGLDFDAKEVATALERAGEGKTGQSVFELVLLCLHGDGVKGRYGPLIWRILQVSVVGTALTVGIGVFTLYRGERRRLRTADAWRNRNLDTHDS